MANKKFHIGVNGPAPCNATKRACRYGEHFDNQSEADSSYAKTMSSSGTLSKKAKVKDEVKADFTLKQLNDLMYRSSTDGIIRIMLRDSVAKYHRRKKAGQTPEELQELAERIHLQTEFALDDKFQNYALLYDQLSPITKNIRIANEKTKATFEISTVRDDNLKTIVARDYKVGRNNRSIEIFDDEVWVQKGSRGERDEYDPRDHEEFTEKINELQNETYNLVGKLHDSSMTNSEKLAEKARATAALYMKTRE